MTAKMRFVKPLWALATISTSDPYCEYLLNDIECSIYKRLARLFIGIFPMLSLSIPDTFGFERRQNT